MATRTRRAAGTSRRRSSEEPVGGRIADDFSDEDYREPSEGYQGEQPTKGLYTCELFGINDHTKQGEDEPSSVRWGFRLVDGSENKHGDDVSGWSDYIYTTENTRWRVQQILVALGVIKPKGKVNLSYDQILKKAKPCTVRVGVERYVPEDGSDPEWRGRMQAFLPLKEAAATKSRRRKDDDEPAEDVFDEDPEADEEEEEEETPPPARRSRRKAEPEPAEDEDEEDEGEDEGEEPYDPDALAAELEDLSVAALKKRAREEFGVRITRGMEAEEIIDAVLDTLDADEDEEEEEPPPPPKRSARAKASPRAKRGSSDKPPF